MKAKFDFPAEQNAKTATEERIKFGTRGLFLWRPCGHVWQDGGEESEIRLAAIAFLNMKPN